MSDQPVSSEAREAHIPEIVGHCDAELYVGCACGWREFDGPWLEHLATPAGPEERGEGLYDAVISDPLVVAWRAFSDQFMDPKYRDDPTRLHIREAFAAGWDAATPAPDTGAEERLRAALDEANNLVNSEWANSRVSHEAATRILNALNVVRARATLHDSASSGTRSETSDE